MKIRFQILLLEKEEPKKKTFISNKKIKLILNCYMSRCYHVNFVPYTFSEA